MQCNRKLYKFLLQSGGSILRKLEPTHAAADFLTRAVKKLLRACTMQEFGCLNWKQEKTTDRETENGGNQLEEDGSRSTEQSWMQPVPYFPSGATIKA